MGAKRSEEEAEKDEEEVVGGGAVPYVQCYEAYAWHAAAATTAFFAFREGS